MAKRMRIVFVVMLVLLGVTNQPKVAEAANTLNGVTFDSENVTVDYDGNYHQPVFTVSDTSGTYSMTYTYVDEDTYESVESSTDLPRFRKPGTHSVKCLVTNQKGNVKINLTSVVTINNPLKMGAISVEPVDYTFQVSWDAVSGVGEYQIVYSTTEDFETKTTETVTVGRTVTTRVMTSTDIQPNTTYYVKVIPMLAVGTAYYPGTASEVCSVTTNMNTDALPNLKTYDSDPTVTEWKIEDAADFAKLNNTFDENVTIYLTKDLTVSSSIADFEYATLYGQGHTVKLSATTITGTPVTGLFQYVNEGTISDLNVEANYSVSTANEKDGEYDSGIIVGMMTGGLIYNCTSQGSVTNGIEGEYIVNVGGIVGAASGTMIACCTNLADVSFKGSSTYTTESTYVGGIAGRIDAGTQVLWCYEKSGSLLNQNTFGKACYTSGIVGYIADNSSVLYSSFCEANVSSSIWVDPITYVDLTNTDRVKGCYYYQKLLINSACRSNSGAAGITVIATKEEALKAAWDMNTSITLGGETGANLAVWGVSTDTNLPYIVSSDNEATYRVTFVKSDGSDNEYAYANGQDTVTYSYTDENDVYELEKIQIGDKTYQAVDGQCEFTMPIKDCEAEVTLKEIEYSIVYHLNGGENNALNPDTYTYSSGFTLGNAVRNGYTFLGWYQEEECSGELVNAIAQGTTGNIELWAKWEANSYTISFADENLNLEEITATYESDISDKKPENPTSEEYVFDGWYTDEELQEEFTFDTMPAKNVVLYAKWSKVSIEDVDVADIANGIYSGKEYEPALELKYRDELLVAEQDYTVEYTDNVNAGTAKAVITGMKKYTGSREVTFIIEKNPEGFALEQSTYNAVYGDDAFTLTITKNGTGAVTYQSDNEDMLTVDKEGTVTILGAGTANVTVTMAEDSNYKKTEKTAKITVAVKEHAGTDHTLELRSQRDATCNQEGFTGNQYCTECGLLVEKGTSIAKLSHEYEQTGSTEATCGTAGSITYRCKLCGDTYSDAIPATGNHQTELRNVKEATCSAEGYTGDIVCKVCGKTQESGTTISKLAHTPGEEKSRVEPTCVATGKRYVVCSVCGNVYSENLPATGVHANTELRNQREATYSSTGYTGDLYCKDCGELIESGKTIAKKEQSASSGEGNTSSSETKSPASGSSGGNAAQQTSGSNGGSSGTTSQTVTTKVSATKIISAKNSKSKRIVVKYKKVSGAKYEISYGTKKNFKGAKVKTTNKTSYTIKGLKKGKTYYVRVRAYKTVNGKKVYSKYTTKKKVVVKK